MLTVAAGAAYALSAVVTRMRLILYCNSVRRVWAAALVCGWRAPPSAATTRRTFLGSWLRGKGRSTWRVV